MGTFAEKITDLKSQMNSSYSSYVSTLTDSDYASAIIKSLRTLGKQARIHMKKLWIPLENNKRYYPIDCSLYTKDEIELIAVHDGQIVTVGDTYGFTPAGLDPTTIEDIDTERMVNIDTMRFAQKNSQSETGLISNYSSTSDFPTNVYLGNAGLQSDMAAKTFKPIFTGVSNLSTITSSYYITNIDKIVNRYLAIDKVSATVSGSSVVGGTLSPYVVYTIITASTMNVTPNGGGTIVGLSGTINTNGYKFYYEHTGAVTITSWETAGEVQSSSTGQLTMTNSVCSTTANGNYWVGSATGVNADKVVATSSLPTFLSLSIQAIPKIGYSTGTSYNATVPIMPQFYDDIDDLCVKELYALLAPRDPEKMNVYVGMLKTGLLRSEPEIIADVKKRSATMDLITIESYQPYTQRYGR